MSRTEALRIQLDNLQLEMQQLKVENAKLREENTEEAALIEAVRRQDQLKEENLQLKAVYDQLLLDSQADQRALEELQAREEELRKELEAAREVAELVHYRELERQRRKWEDREERLLQQIAELQKCVEVADRLRGRRELSYSSMEDDESVSGGDAGDARLGVTSSGARLGVTSSAMLRVTPSGPPVVSDYVQLVSTSIIT